MENNLTPRLTGILEAVGEEDLNETYLTYLLDLSTDEIMSRRYTSPSQIPKEFPTYYETLAIDIAKFLYFKLGAEGEVGHSEGGISRSYANAFIPEEMFRGITPVVRTF